MTNPIDRLLAYQIDAGHYPGAVVHVERDGHVLVHRVAGLLRPDADEPMDEHALFRIASLTKPVVTIAALMQVDEGKLALDAPVADYLPSLAELRLPAGDRPSRPPTVRDLMRHTAGLAYPPEIRDARTREAVQKSKVLGRMPHVSVDSFIDAIAVTPLAAEPGTRFQYGFSTDVLGAIVATLDDRSLAEVLQTRLFVRLGMDETGFQVSAADQARLASAHPADAAWHTMVPPLGIAKEGQPWMDSGGGGLVSTLADYAAFARMLANGGCMGSERVISESLFAEMARDQLPPGADGPAGYTGPGFGFGLGLAVRLDWGPAAMPCATGELCWSGISGTAMFVHPRERWFAVAFSANMSSRLMARMEFRRAVAML